MKKLIIIAIVTLSTSTIFAQSIDNNTSDASERKAHAEYLNKVHAEQMQAQNVEQNGVNDAKVQKTISNEIVDGLKPDGTPAAMPIPKVTPTETPINPAEAELRSRSKK